MKTLFPNLNQYIDQLPFSKEGYPYSLTEDRASLLEKMAAYISEKLANNGSVRLNFICTHNSRRSHFSQIWAHIASHYYGLNNVYTFSGGTEATAFNINAVNAIRKTGAILEVSEDGPNPVYSLTVSNEVDAYKVWSKTYDDPANGNEPFAAVMTCSHADDNCPYIPNAEQRFPLRFEDPKISDGTPAQEEIYAERCAEIASQLLYCFSLVNKQ